MRADLHELVFTRKDQPAPLVSAAAFVGAPVVVLWCVILTLFVSFVPEFAAVGSWVPLLLLLTARSLRPILGACLVGNLFMLFGGTGEVEFIGYLIISPDTTTKAICFSNALATTVYVLSQNESFSSGTKLDRLRGVSVSLHVAVLIMAILLLLVRFTSGIPLLQGDAGRLSGLLTVNPYLGLASGVLPIAASYLVSKGSAKVAVLRIFLVVLVVGTGSRLLLAAVLLGMVMSSPFMRQRLGGRKRFYLLAAGVIALVAITRIYAARTEEGIQQIYASRIDNLDGPAGFVSDLLGPSLFYAARNGLVVSEILQNKDLQPPGGFIIGGLLHAFNFGADPEKWLTAAIGFDVNSVGAVATPVWAGANADFGQFGSVFLAVLIGAVMTLVLRRVPELEFWFAFGILLSFYGSYLVSAQFVAASLLIAVVVLSSRSRSHNTMPNVMKPEAKN